MLLEYSSVVAKHRDGRRSVAASLATRPGNYTRRSRRARKPPKSCPDIAEGAETRPVLAGPRWFTAKVGSPAKLVDEGEVGPKLTKSWPTSAMYGHRPVGQVKLRGGVTAATPRETPTLRGSHVSNTGERCVRLRSHPLGMSTNEGSTKLGAPVPFESSLGLLE